MGDNAPTYEKDVDCAAGEFLCTTDNGCYDDNYQRAYFEVMDRAWVQPIGDYKGTDVIYNNATENATANINVE